jgi:dTDP-glucose 4,6-dehydratase
VPIDERHPLQAQSPYAATKIGADKLVEAFGFSYELPVVTVRPFNTYGPRQSSRAIVPTIITQALTDSRVRLGSLTPSRDMNYVRDTVEGFVLAGLVPEAIGRTFNIGSGREIQIGELAKLIGQLIGCSLEIEHEPQRVRPRDSEVERLLAETTAAREVLGWQPTITLEEGLATTIQWVREHLHAYRPGVYAV